MAYTFNKAGGFYKPKTAAQLKAEGMALKKKGQAMKKKGQAAKKITAGQVAKVVVDKSYNSLKNTNGNNIAKAVYNKTPDAVATRMANEVIHPTKVKNNMGTTTKINTNSKGTATRKVTDAKGNTTTKVRTAGGKEYVKVNTASGKVYTPSAKKPASATPVKATPVKATAPVKTTATPKPKTSTGTKTSTSYKPVVNSAKSVTEEATPLAKKEVKDIIPTAPVELAKSTAKPAESKGVISRIKSKISDAIKERKERKMNQEKTKMKTGGMVNPNASIKRQAVAGSKGVKSGMNPRAAASKVTRGRVGGTSMAPRKATPGKK